MKIKKVISSLVIATTLSFSLPTYLTSCSDIQSKVYDTLVNMPDVVKVEKISLDYTNRYVYDVWFKQPIDWNNQFAGSFNQCVRFSFAGFDAMNQMFFSGYRLLDLLPNRYNDLEAAMHFNGNTIRPEYRFFGNSCPNDISDYSLKYWDYLTVENAAYDFHHIIESFKTAFSGKWIVSGSSKGGFTTNAHAMIFPKDANAYISYVAPKANGISEEKMYKVMFMETGTTEPKLETHRKELAKFIHYAIKNSNDIVEKYFKPFIESSMEYRYNDFFLANLNKAYEVCIGELAVYFWQYEEDANALARINEMTNAEEKMKEAFDLIVSWSEPNLMSITNRNMFAYCTQGYKQMGEHAIKFQYLIDFVNEFFNDDKLTRNDFATQESEEDAIFFKLSLTPKQLSTWEYDPNIKVQMENWYTTNNQANVVMIYGCCDPWTSMSLTAWSPNKKCDDIKVFIGKDKDNVYCRSHRVRIAELPEQDQREIWQFLDDCLK